MSTETADPGHGHSPAAWTSVTIMLIAVTIGTVAFFLDLQWLVWASAVVLVIGLIVGWVLSRAGYGVGGDKVTPKAH
jgi:hydrogenase-4 membrane subunit HyfE